MQRELAPHELILLAPSVVVPRSREDADSAAASAPGSSMELAWQHERRARRIAVARPGGGSAYSRCTYMLLHFGSIFLAFQYPLG